MKATFKSFIHRHVPKVPAFRLGLGALISVSTLFGGSEAQAASQTWGANSATVWLTTGNWLGNALPGTQGAAASSTDVATWTSAATATSFGINMNTASGGYNLGAISCDSTRTIATSIGDSSTTVAGVLRLYGSTVNGVSDVVIRNAGSGLITLQALQSFAMTMTLNDATADKVYIDGTGGITITCNLSGNAPTLFGSGSGIFTLGGTNSFVPGGFTVNSGYTLQTLDNASPIAAGTLTLSGGIYQRGAQNFTPARANAFTNSVLVTATSTIQTTAGTTRVAHFDVASFSGPAGTTLTLKNTAAGTGFFRFYHGLTNYLGDVAVGTGGSGTSVLQIYNLTTDGDMAFSGLISGPSLVYKNIEGSSPGGNVIFSNANTYTGGTEVRAGFFGLGTNNALGFGKVTFGFDLNPLGLYAVGGAWVLTNDIVADPLIVNSTNLQIKGSQNLTLSGRILFTNIIQFTISNTALTTLSGVVTNMSVNAVGLTKTGPGNLLLSGAAIYSGSTRVLAGTLTFTNTAAPLVSTNYVISGGATMDISGLSSTLAMASSQAFQVANPVTNATLICSGTAGLTLGSTSPLTLAFSNSFPSLTVTGGVLTVASGNPAVVTVSSGGIGLPAGAYKLISAGPGGSVGGVAPTSLTVNGDGISGSSPSLVISNSELYLFVQPSTTPPATPVAKTASSTNVTSFTASWNSASGADTYQLDVSTASDFSAIVAGYNSRNVTNVTSFVVTNLNPATTYYYQVRGTNAFGTSGNSATITVTTYTAPFVWNTGDGYWSDGTRWQYGSAPTNGAFPGYTGAGGKSTNDLTGLLLSTLTFSNGAGAYVVSGNGLVVSNGILNSSTAAQTISAPITLGLAQTLNSATGPLNIAGPITNAGNQLTVTTTVTSTNSGSISGTGSLIKNGAGTLLLSGANTYTGATTNNAGNLEVAGGSALPDTATLVLANTAGVSLTVDANETLGSISSGDNSTIALGANLTAGGDGTITTNTASITGVGKFVKAGAGTMIMNKATAYGSSFILRVEGGTADLNRAGALLTGILGTGNRIELAGGNLQLSGSAQANFAMSIAGLDVFSDSTLTFNRTGGSSSQSPTVTLPITFKADSKLSFAYSASVTAGTSTFDGAANTLQGNGTFVLGPYTIAIANPIGESGGSYGITKSGAGQLNLQAVNTYSGNTTNAQGVISVNGTSTLGNGTGTLVFTGGSLLDANTRASAPIANPVLLLADATIYGDGLQTNSLRLFPMSGLINQVAGALIFRNEDANATSTNNEFRVRLSASGLTLTNSVVIGSASDLPISNAIVELDFFNLNTDAPQTVSGNVSGTGALYRSLAAGGITILSGSNSYAGGTLVSGGTLLVNSQVGSGTGTNPVIVITNGVLGGNGIIASTVTNVFPSTLAPGLGGLDTSTLTISNTLGLAGNALFIVNRTNAQTSAKVAGLSSVRYGGTLTLTNVGNPLQAGDTFTLFSSAAYSGAFTNIILPAIDPSLVWVTNTLAVNGSVSVGLAIVPTTTALSSSANPSGYLDTLTFTAVVTPTNASGLVTFYTGATPFSTNTLVAGTAVSGSINSLLRGTTNVTAIYNGSLPFASSTNSVAQTVTNHPPVAGNATYSFLSGLSLKIKVSELLTNVTDVDGDTITLSGAAVSTNGVTPDTTSLAGYIVYTNGNVVNDKFNYSVSDGFGGSATGAVTIVQQPFVTGQSSTVAVGGSSATVSFAGIVGYTYGVQRSTNVTDWVTIWTTNLSSPLFNYTDTFTDLGVVPTAAYYRLQWNP